MGRSGNVQPSDPTAEMVNDMFGGIHREIEDAHIGVAVPITVALPAGINTVRSFQNPFDSPCLVAVAVNVSALDGGETIDIGVGTGAASDDTLVDGASLATVRVFSSYNTIDNGTNGRSLQLVDQKGGANDRVVYQTSAGTDTLVATLTMIFMPLG